MQHMTLKAVTTATDQDQGTFRALVSSWSRDREGDEIEHGAFDETISAWRASGKMLPLLFEHSTEEIGAINPATMDTTDEGLVVSGEVDRATPNGQQAWRQIRRGSASFSIGYLADHTPRKGGGRILHRIDLLEISLTSTPMNADSRVLDWKSAATAENPLIEALNLAYLAADETHRKAIAADELRTKAERTAAEFLPVKVATFEC